MYLHSPDAMEVVWFKEFKTFSDKSSAISFDTGVDRKLSEMIMKWLWPGQMLVVGKPEYKTIIETNMGVPCLWDETVMEVMWGLKNIMPSLVPQEKSELTREDRLPMSQGLKRLLNGYGFDVKPEMVNERIILTACALLDCQLIDKKHFASLKEVGEHIKDVSGINTENWGILKLATSLMIIFYPEEKIVAGNPKMMFTDAERLKLQEDAQVYNEKILKWASLRIYEEIVCAHEARSANFALLSSLVKEAKQAYEAERSAEQAQQTS
ncbi:unnamed protein product [Urochloa decumbens]|uniref:Uncharacterized protein n=1 Tax=Urochloa decumbens TaxID=240449 RepID=A0ABC8Z779_9POAL